MKEEAGDKFIAMVSAKAETDLRLSDFAPRPALVVPAHDVTRAKFPAIDFHNHLDALDPARVLRVINHLWSSQGEITGEEDVPTEVEYGRGGARQD